MASARRSMLKRKRKAEEAAKEGFRWCKKCHNEKPEAQFKNKQNREFTKYCLHCRKVQGKVNEKHKAPLRENFRNWQAANPCLHCGRVDCIEADHLRDKVHRCSHFNWWMSHGGVEAQSRELEKCQPLCAFCHRLKTKKERKKTKRKYILRRQAVINEEKLRRGCCLHCARKVTLETCCAYDFDHRNPKEKKYNVSQMVYLEKSMFYALVHTEMKKCDVLCACCHFIKTNM